MHALHEALQTLDEAQRACSQSLALISRAVHDRARDERLNDAWRRELERCRGVLARLDVGEAGPWAPFQ